MLLSRRHWQWWIVFVAGFVLSTLLYVVFGRTATPEGPFGGTKPGLWFGIVGSVAMLAAAFLAVRKKFPIARWILGNARFWLQVHIWIGTLSVWLILLHSGFRLGGPFEQILMWFFLFVAFSGFYGLAMQQYIPRMMTERVPAETFAQQVPVLRRRLLVEADWLTADAAGTLPIPLDVGHEDVEPVYNELKTYFKENPEQDTFKSHGVKKVEDFVGFVYTAPETPAAESPESAAAASGDDGNAAPDSAPAATKPAEPPRDPMAERLSSFYLDIVRPYLQGRAPGSPLANKATADIQFDSLSSPLPPRLRRAAREVEEICDSHRQYGFQQRLLWWLHSWLYLHVPASMVLLVLFVVHVYLALRVVPPG